jgi:uncharacterized Zn-finger protein
MTARALNETANAASCYRVSRADLPLSCPMPHMVLWCSHPKVYLPIEATGWAKCPYCSAEFQLDEVLPQAAASAPVETTFSGSPGSSSPRAASLRGRD